MHVAQDAPLLPPSFKAKKRRRQLDPASKRMLMRDLADWGRDLRRLRKQVPGLTQAKLAKLAGLSRTTIVNLEHGYCYPSRATIAAIQKVLDVRSLHQSPWLAKLQSYTDEKDAFIQELLKQVEMLTAERDEAREARDGLQALLAEQEQLRHERAVLEARCTALTEETQRQQTQIQILGQQAASAAAEREQSQKLCAVQQAHIQELEADGQTLRTKIHALTEDKEAVAAHVRVDPMTGLKNRLHLQEQLPIEVAAAHRNGVPFSLLMLDVDHFKQYNDAHGHPAGDEALKAVATCIQASTRPTDHAIRYGGEEMAVLLPGASAQQARGMAERIRGQIEAMELQPAGVTVSIGVAAYHPPPGEDGKKAKVRTGKAAEALLKAADQALYAAKKAGRNRVHVHGETVPKKAGRRFLVHPLMWMNQRIVRGPAQRIVWRTAVCVVLISVLASAMYGGDSRKARVLYLASGGCTGTATTGDSTPATHTCPDGYQWMTLGGDTKCWPVATATMPLCKVNQDPDTDSCCAHNDQRVACKP